MVVQAAAAKTGTRIVTQTGTRVVRNSGARETERVGTRPGSARRRGGSRTRTRRTRTRVTRVSSQGGVISEPDPRSITREFQNAWSRTESEMEAVFEQNGEELSDELKDDIVNDGEEQTVVFPIVMLAVALLDDVVFDPVQLTVVGAVLTFIMGKFVTLTLIIWFFGKMNGRLWKRAMVKWFWVRFIGVIVIESLPIISLVPATTILVFMAANREKKFAQMFNEALEAFHGSGLKGYVKR